MGEVEALRLEEREAAVGGGSAGANFVDAVMA